jgi:hypothetical protein
VIESDRDLLAPVVLHVLIAASPEAWLGLERLARACERDPANQRELGEISQVLGGLVDDGRAQSRGTTFRPTRAAIRVEQLRI